MTPIFHRSLPKLVLLLGRLTEEGMEKTLNALLGAEANISAQVPSGTIASLESICRREYRARSKQGGYDRRQSASGIEDQWAGC